MRVLDRRRARRVDAEPARCLEVDVGRRLAARDLLRRDRVAHDVGEPGTRSTTSISSGFDDEAIATGTASAIARTTSARAVDQRRRLAVAGEHPLHDRRVDLLGRAGQRQLLRHVASTTRSSSCPSSPASPSRCSGRRPRRVYCSRTSSQTCSESTITPSRSKITASVTARRTPGARRRATSLPRLPRSSAAHRRRTCGRRSAPRRPSARSPSRPRPAAGADRPRARRSRSRARSAARRARSAARGAPAPRRGSTLPIRRTRAAARAATPAARSRCRRAVARARARSRTRRSARHGGRPTSATTTETPSGHRRKRERCSAPRSSTRPSLVEA